MGVVCCDALTSNEILIAQYTTCVIMDEEPYALPVRFETNEYLLQKLCVKFLGFHWL